MRNGEERTYTVRGVRPGSGGAATLVRFEEFDDRTFAQSLAGMVLTVPACDAPELPAGQYYVHQIEGLRVRSDDGRDLGVIAEVMQPGANDVYVVDGPLGELLIPAIPDVVQRVDLSEGVMVVHCPPGLLPDDTAR
jgi:16S rRNA processing protein RimM